MSEAASGDTSTKVLSIVGVTVLIAAWMTLLFAPHVHR